MIFFRRHHSPLLIKLLLFISITALVLGLLLLFWASRQSSSTGILSPISKLTNPRPLDVYTFDSLTQRLYQPSPIVEEATLAQEDGYISYLFSFSSDGKKVTGQLNVPSTTDKLPAIIMLRGYVDPNIYQAGIGTKPAAAVFAANGFATFAPDFLGYGGSDPPDSDVFAARLEHPVTVLNLIASVKALDYIDPNNIFIWGHSNGGQIALSVLEISKASYPTTLWAPVSKGFPYNILYYTDESDDYGKALRHELAKFETTYNTDLFSIHRYFDRINAPVQIHQGGTDDAVPMDWSNQLVDTLNTIKDSTTSGQFLDVTYYKYPASDHNLRPDWNTVVARDLDFFRSHLQ